MADELYKVLGLTRNATSEEVKSAYRRLVKTYHPDHAPDTASTEKFLKVQNAYEALSDPSRRAEYDRLQTMQEQLRKESEQRCTQAAKSPPKQTPQSPPRKPAPQPTATPTVAAEVSRLSTLFSKGKLAEAEVLARKIIERDARAPLPYAVLGDVARQRGNLAEASKMYAYAAQFDPMNSVYLRKHEELLQRVSDQHAARTSAQPDKISPAPFVGFGIALAACLYVAFSREAAILPGIAMIRTWTLGLITMLFISGVAVGASLSAGRLLDRFGSFTTNAVGKISPSVALAPVALVSFWAATSLYFLLGVAQKSFSFSISRLLGAVTAVVFMAMLAAVVSGRIEPLQVFLWGGNIAYFGALCGWMVADSMRGV